MSALALRTKDGSGPSTITNTYTRLRQVEKVSAGSPANLPFILGPSTESGWQMQPALMREIEAAQGNSDDPSYGPLDKVVRAYKFNPEECKARLMFAPSWTVPQTLVNYGGHFSPRKQLRILQFLTRTFPYSVKSFASRNPDYAYEADYDLEHLIRFLNRKASSRSEASGSVTEIDMLLHFQKTVQHLFKCMDSGQPVHVKDLIQFIADRKNFELVLGANEDTRLIVALTRLEKILNFAAERCEALLKTDTTTLKKLYETQKRGDDAMAVLTKQTEVDKIETAKASYDAVKLTECFFFMFLGCNLLRRQDLIGLLSDTCGASSYQAEFEDLEKILESVTTFCDQEEQYQGSSHESMESSVDKILGYSADKKYSEEIDFSDEEFKNNFSHNGFEIDYMDADLEHGSGHEYSEHNLYN